MSNWRQTTITTRLGVVVYALKLGKDLIVPLIDSRGPQKIGSSSGAKLQIFTAVRKKKKLRIHLFVH